MPSPRPSKPRCSVVVAFTPTFSTPIPRALANFARISSRCGESFGACAATTESTSSMRKPASRTACAAASSSTVEAINANPAAYAPLLAEKANLNEAIASDYPVSTYPAALRDGRPAYPKDSMVQPVLTWMAESGYGGNVSYDEATGALTR